VKSPPGLWIDHSQASIVMLSGDKEKIEHITSDIVGVETTDKMTENQIVARVRQHFPKTRDKA